MKPLNVLYLIRTWDLGGSHTIIRLLLKHMPRDRFNIITKEIKPCCCCLTG